MSQVNNFAIETNSAKFLCQNFEANKIGFKYNPKLESLSNKKKTVSYSFEKKSKIKTHSSNFGNVTSTDVNLGPNSYLPDFNKLSFVKKMEKVSFSKEDRFFGGNPSKTNYDTFADYSSMGFQMFSSKKNALKATFGNEKKTCQNHLPAQNNLTIKYRLPHAHF